MKSLWVCVLLTMCGMVSAQQLPNAGFEDWSGSTFDGKIQPASWNASNVTQFGFKFNFAHQEGGHTGKYSMMVQDQDIGAAGITETSPGYFSLGQPWVYIESLTKVSEATAGTYGGISFKYRPDTMAVWIKRTGGNVLKEDFHLLFYSWKGTAKSGSYKGKNGSCTSTSKTDEESDIRLSTDGNECGTAQKAQQVSEGWWKEKKEYGSWTLIKVPIFYAGGDIPEKCNVIFSASNYPNFRANSGLYAGNSLYVDDVQLIYSSKIQTLYIDGMPWNGFNPNSEEEQIYSLGEHATSIPEIYAMRGTGSLTNSKGQTTGFPGRRLTGDEITIEKGKVGEVTTITVRAEDGSSTTTYKIRFMKQASSNTYLDKLWIKKSATDSVAVSSFSPYSNTCTVELPYGTTQAPTLSVSKQEQGQSFVITQAKSLSDKATIVVTAADKKTKRTYTVDFTVAKLSDNTLQDILVNGMSVPEFSPTKTIYRVSLPLGTTEMPIVEAKSAYPQDAQKIEYIKPEKIDGGTYQVKVTVEGNPLPKIYKLTFVLEPSTYSKLKDIQVGEGLLNNFDPNQYTYYVNLPMGSTELPKITYTLGDNYQTVTKTEGGVNGTTLLTVKAASGALSVYKLIFTTPQSEENRLKMIYLNGEALQGFSPDKRTYNISMPIETTAFPKVTWETMDEYETVEMTEGGFGGTTRLTVTAGNGETNVYQLVITKEESANCSLQMITIGGKEIADFSPEQTEYTCTLATGASALPEVGYTTGDAYQKITVRKPSGMTGDYRLTVRAGNGDMKTYTIHFVVAMSSNNALKMIRLNGVDFVKFDPDTLNYVDTLTSNKIPSVETVKAEASQKILNVLENNVQRIRVTAENGEKREYTITFVIPKSENAYLKMIYLNGDSLQGFQKEQLTYVHQLQTTTCPTITTDKEEGQQVTVAAPFAGGEAQIVVRTESGDENIYLINFLVAATKTVQLKDILLDGVSLKDFDPKKVNYTIPYEKQMPTVTPVMEDGQQAEVLTKGEEVSIYVNSSEARVVYVLTFQRSVSQDCYLRSIMADGVEIPDFVPEKKEYTVVLDAGAQISEITFVRNHETQVVQFGQTDPLTRQIIVTAEDRTSQSIYLVHFERTLYADATLEDLKVEGLDLAFVPEQTEYTLTYDAGLELPMLHLVTKPGQTTLVNTISETEQEVLVMAENGNRMRYQIHYVRPVSDNALLKDILLDGVSVAGFDPAVTEYRDTLPWRTRVVPSVHPVGMMSEQTITTYVSSVNGTTRIHVEAPNGENSNDYYIHFPVRQSSNSALKSLYVNHEDVQIDFDAKTTEYAVELPIGDTIAPTIFYEKAEEEQRVSLISRPLGQKSKVKVFAENGDSTIYTIAFSVKQGKEPNLLTMIRIKELDIELSLKDKNKREFEVDMPYGSRTFTIEYEKSYPEQSVMVQPGGVNQPTIITVLSNRKGVEDETYTITPKVQVNDPAVLTDIKVNDVSISGFQSEQFAYIVPVSEKPILRYTLNKGAEINILSQTSKHWQAEVSYEGRTNVYNVWYYYVNDVVPNSEFTEWTNCSAYTSATKPSGWNTIADVLGKHSGFFSFTPDELVRKQGTDEVHLSTQYSTPGGGEIPGFITLGSVSGSWGVAGSSNFAVSGGISFHNTPDIMQVRYYNKSVQNNSLIQYILTGSDGTYTMEHKDKTTASSYKVVDINLGEANHVAGEPTLLNIVFDSYYQISGTIASSSPEMYVDWLRFSFNHTLKGLQVNGKAATMSGTTFTSTLTDPEYVETPILTFTGEVEDQAQTVTWTPETISGEYGIRTAAIRNFAENGTDYTDYTLEVKRPLSIVNTLDSMRVGNTIIRMNDSQTDYVIETRFGQPLPDVYPYPSSSRQTIKTALQNNKVTITVTPEYGEDKIYTVTFTQRKSTNTKLVAIIGVENFDPNVYIYTLSNQTIPNISFTKAYDAQEVKMKDSVITVLAEDSIHTAQYIIRLSQPQGVTSAQLSELALDGTPWQGFQPSTYAYTHKRPEWTAYTRTDNSDSIVFTQYPDSMTWRVIGNATEHTYKMEYPYIASTETSLKGIYVDGNLLKDFMPSLTDYVLSTDTTVDLLIVKEEKKQQVTVTQTDRVYTIQVTAEDVTKQNQYTLVIEPEQSADATLHDLMLDGVTIEGFRPDSFLYRVVIPVGEVKKEEPALPSLTYVVSNAKATVDVQSASLNETAYIDVTAGDGNHRNTYEVLVESEKSHNSSLTGIVVNRVPVEHFESGRHYYSCRSNSDEVTLEWTSDDNFQTYKVDTIGSEYLLTVTAQDGVEKETYTIDVFVESKPTDATLSNILLNDSVEFVDFERNLNKNLRFDPNNNTYAINLPSGTTIAPSVNAQLKMDGQKVDVQVNGMTTFIKVTAKDGVTTNTYTLQFTAPKSQDATLMAILLDGDSLQGFTPDDHFYTIALPVGKSQIPEIYAAKGEPHQSEPQITTKGQQVNILVTAENTDFSSVYTLLFSFTKSEEARLGMVYADNDSLPKFDKDSFNYYLTLPVQTRRFPTLTYDSLDTKQQITQRIVNTTSDQQITQIEVVAESGIRNIYTVSYSIQKDSTDILNAIYVNNKRLTGFDPYITEYSDTLPANTTELPKIDYESGSPYQIIRVDTLIETLSMIKSLGVKVQIQVLAENNSRRVYAIHFPIALSTNTDLNMIFNNGQPLATFNKEVYEYDVKVPYDVNGARIMPSITVSKAEEAQNVDIVPQGDSLIFIRVLAEDDVTSATYKVRIFYQKSPVVALRGILVNGDTLLNFRPDTVAYQLHFFTTDTMPKVEWLKTDSAQTLDETQTKVSDQIVKLDCSVTSPDGEHFREYSLALMFDKTSVDTMAISSRLTTLKVKGQVVGTASGFDFDFLPDTLHYLCVYPLGSNGNTCFFDSSAISYETEDPLAFVNIDISEREKKTDTIGYTFDSVPIFRLIERHITLIVTDRNRQNPRSYVLTQKVALSRDSAISEIILGGDPFLEFDPKVHTYTRNIKEGTIAPFVTCITADSLATSTVITTEEEENGKKVYVSNIVCMSEYATVEGNNALRNTYTIRFVPSTLNESKTPFECDVLIKRIPYSTQVVVASLRSNVQVGFYDMNGQMLLYRKLIAEDPSNVVTTIDGNGQTYFANVADVSKCQVLTLEPNRLYFYCFTENGKKKIVSGKMMIVK